MAFGNSSNLVRVFKPIAAGLALAFLATAMVDKPAPVHFQPENPYAAKQAEILEPQAELVIEKNIMKLGSLLSVTAVGSVTQEGLPVFSSPVVSDEIEVLSESNSLPNTVPSESQQP
ncbi:hypothetical protein SYK_28450 [Pseudodesulfovibrio nedwellii]|uniref:Uncharacterized protein n=1 Tax=Pseudodesulfovibrio nedwellii TaxID=2973072 RepID=A0ABN6S981_9BACT|nr:MULTISPECIES: hypothetical protein [Pseudodesulfovibrio]BDQ38485.1 hypothetical protein SYK_28450 [Pseudodesulfovibrio nedwellii]